MPKLWSFNSGEWSKRKPLNIPLKNILESLQGHRSVTAAAKELGCSQAYIFGVLKANRLRLKDVIGSQQRE